MLPRSARRRASWPSRYERGYSPGDSQGVPTPRRQRPPRRPRSRVHPERLPVDLAVGQEDHVPGPAGDQRGHLVLAGQGPHDQVRLVLVDDVAEWRRSRPPGGAGRGRTRRPAPAAGRRRRPRRPGGPRRGPDRGAVRLRQRWPGWPTRGTGRWPRAPERPFRRPRPLVRIDERNEDLDVVAAGRQGDDPAVDALRLAGEPDVPRRPGPVTVRGKRSGGSGAGSGAQASRLPKRSSSATAKPVRPCRAAARSAWPPPALTTSSSRRWISTVRCSSRTRRDRAVLVRASSYAVCRSLRHEGGGAEGESRRAGPVPPGETVRPLPGPPRRGPPGCRGGFPGGAGDIRRPIPRRGHGAAPRRAPRSRSCASRSSRSFRSCARSGDWSRQRPPTRAPATWHPGTRVGALAEASSSTSRLSPLSLISPVRTIRACVSAARRATTWCSLP